MKKGYKINIDLVKISSNANKVYDKQRDEFKLEEIVDATQENGPILDGKKIINRWFPQQNDKNIFISHSHGDETRVTELANYLENLGNKVFVDSTVWGSCFELMNGINDRFNITKLEGDSKTYSYNGVQNVSANMYLILTNALNKMINQCDVFIFVESKGSVENNKTYSPWIMEELNLYEILHEQQQKILNEKIEKRSFENITVKVVHDIEEILDGMDEITSEEQLKRLMNIRY